MNIDEDSLLSAPKILQIIPADGWYAFFKEEEGSLDSAPLVCFALVENADGGNEVRPMFWNESQAEFADDYDNFEGIEKLGMSEDDWEIDLEEGVMQALGEEPSRKD